MKKLIAIVLLVATLLAGCAEPRTEVSRVPVDVSYTEAYDAIETDYDYKYNVWEGEWQLVPVMKTVHHNAKWEIQYRIVYDNGTEKTEWCNCTEAEYNRVKDQIG